MAKNCAYVGKTKKAVLILKKPDCHELYKPSGTVILATSSRVRWADYVAGMEEWGSQGMNMGF